MPSVYVICHRNEHGDRRVLHDAGGKDRPELWGPWPGNGIRPVPAGAATFARKAVAQRIARASSESNYVLQVR